MLFWSLSPSFKLTSPRCRFCSFDGSTVLVMYKSSSGGQERGSLFSEAICFSNAVRAQFRIIFNMNEKLEPLEQADGVFVFSPPDHELVCFFFLSTFIILVVILFNLVVPFFPITWFSIHSRSANWLCLALLFTHFHPIPHVIQVPLAPTSFKPTQGSWEEQGCWKQVQLARWLPCQEGGAHRATSLPNVDCQSETAKRVSRGLNLDLIATVLLLLVPLSMPNACSFLA